MAVRSLWNVAVCTILFAHTAFAQDEQLALTPAGRALLQSKLAADSQAQHDGLRPARPLSFPLPMCAFAGGRCGAVHRDGSIAVQPRYDWVGTFSEGRAAVRLEGLYGFVDEQGREIVKPRYRIVDDYKFGFAQVDVDGKSGLIDRNGKMVIEPKYGLIEAIAADRFRVSEQRQIGGPVGGERFSDLRVEFTSSGSVSVSWLPEHDQVTAIINSAGQLNRAVAVSRVRQG
jgi:hypothetical protein